MNAFLLLLTAVVAVAGAAGYQAFPETLLDHLVRRGLRSRVRCSGDVSEDMKACVKPLENVTNSNSGLPLDKVNTREKLNIVCRERVNAAHCVNQVHDRCGQGDVKSEIAARTALNIVGYVCDPDHDEVLFAHKECWENEELARKIDTCGDDFDYNDDPCDILIALRRCFVRHVRTECNDEAADYMDGFAFAMLEYVANDFFDCKMGPRLPPVRSRVRCSGNITADISACLKPLENLTDPKTGLGLDSADTREELNIVCSERENAAHCVNQVRDKCGQGDVESEVLTRTALNVVGYICDPVNDEVLFAQKECWENEKLARKIDACGDDFNHNGDLCDELATMRRCILGNVRRKCNYEAMVYIKGYTFALFDYVANDLLQCRMRYRLARSLLNTLPHSKK